MDLFRKILLFVFLTIAQTPIKAVAWYETPPMFLATITSTVFATKFGLDSLNYLTTKITKVSPTIPIKTTQIGLIEITGEIDYKLAYNTQKLIDKFRQDPFIQAVIVMIDSGGGTGGYDYFLNNEFRQLRALKPVIAVVPAFCCSAAYMIACAANAIIASSNAEIGSIGVLQTIIKLSGNTINYKSGNTEGTATVELLKAGANKALLHRLNSTPLDADQIASLQEKIDIHYNDFCIAVAAQRNLNLDEKNIWADGQIFIATKALQLGLIDQIGSLIDAKKAALQLIKQKKPNASDHITLITQ